VLTPAFNSEEFGISNFMVDDVKKVLEICKREGYIRPTVYQGAFSMIYRGLEAEMMPLLRANGIRFAAFSPLAGGYLTGRLLPSSDSSEPKKLSHFDAKKPTAEAYSKMYLPTGPALTEFHAFVKTQGLTLPEVAYRWLQWHSAMVPEDHGIILGFSSITQLEASIADW
jgi:aflatoxin B1 aldehyde reductase